jgi:hypothetical protein
MQNQTDKQHVRNDFDVLLCRCMVESVRMNRATVFFLDYGNRDVVMLVEIRQIPPALQLDLATIPALAMECSIAGIQPNQARYTSHINFNFMSM